ncbi:ELMOD3 [Symbiodinium natans]|uniref:ELMOD3 protein n=1 Tax=Symbiodinium natans TaxID=878477 RepID=A0A812N950_9DINO|nr:ELMOD3 [Symbiodinium natans]
MPSWCDPRLALTPVQAEESAADDIVFDLGPQDETVRARAKANSSWMLCLQAPPAIEVDDVLHIGLDEDSDAGESIKSADLLQIIQQASEVEISSDSVDSRQALAPAEPDPPSEAPRPHSEAVAEARSAHITLEEGAGETRPSEVAPPRTPDEEDEKEESEIQEEEEVQAAPSRASGAEVTFAVGGFAATPAEALEPAAPPEPVVAQREEDVPRASGIDEMFADILAPIPEAQATLPRVIEAAPEPAAPARSSVDAVAASSRIVAAEPAGPLRRNQESASGAAARAEPSRSLAAPVSKLANLMQESTERREPVPQNSSPANSSVCNREADEDASLDKEWDEIARRTDELIANARESKGVVAVSQDVLSQPLSYKDFTQWLLQLEIDPAALRQMREEMIEDDLAGCGCFMKRMRPRSEVPGLERRFWAEKDLVLFLKVTHFDFNDTVHHRMLRTMYGKLSRNKVCPTVGRHWELLGFQSGDPRTDLNRSGGVLNVMQMFYFFSHHFDLMKSAYLLAQDAQHNFPLACVSINITKMVIECLLEGRLSKLCNGSRGVFEMTCLVYSAAFFHWYWRWRTQKRSIRDTELTFKEVRALLERRPAKLLDMLQQGIAESKAKADPSRLEFTDIDFGGARGAGKGNQAVPDGLQRYQYDE